MFACSPLFSQSQASYTVEGSISTTSMYYSLLLSMVPKEVGVTHWLPWPGIPSHVSKGLGIAVTSNIVTEVENIVVHSKKKLKK